ncbi:MAG: DUF6020 family protein [Eubacterium sp.]|nr:DUF6020 family protein [Eubacterium sp.]MCM1215847.1 DUF6020 family protein [Lachnospiraceae bacterium]MCM1239227.1 DUF6020 family protein [Lachnospiraceae bacterium]
MTGFLFVFFCLTGKELAAEGNILWTGGYLLRILSVSLLAGGTGGSALCFGMYRLASGGNSRKREAAKLRKLPGGAVFGGSFLLLVLGWLPGYLAYYPAICTYDSPIQVGQIGENAFIDHHPIAHTLLIKGAMSLGRGILGSVNRGIGVYAMLQLLLLASVFAFGIWRLYEHGIRPLWLLSLLVLLMVYPFNAYLSISVTKDTVFSAFFVLQVLSIYELLYKDSRARRVTWRELLFFCSTVGMMLFRNNGKYAFLVFSGVLAVMVLFGRQSRKQSGKLLVWSAAGFLAGNVALAALFGLTNARQGDKREMLSMPIQQLARCMIYHGGAGALPEDDDTMEEADKALIRDFILDEGYREYDPAISDPVKRHTNTYVVRYRLKEFASTYFRLLGRYPGDFVNAALAVDAGYLYPGDVTHAYVNTGQGLEGMGYVQTRWSEDVFAGYGIYKDSKWEWLHERMERWADENAYLNIPVLRYLFMPGIWVWLYLLLFGWLVVRKAYGRCLPLALILGYYATLLLGPVVQLRYIYPLMAAFPFAFLMSICDRNVEPPGRRDEKDDDR